MRYQRLSYRYMVVATTGSRRFLETPDRTAVTVREPRWRPDTDVYETDTALVIVVDLAGVDDGDIDAMLFEDVLVVEGERRLPSCAADAVYHAASIRQGPFRVAIALPSAVDPEGVEGHCERGLLRIILPKIRRS
jgi:HSP20 family protein